MKKLEIPSFRIPIHYALQWVLALVCCLTWAACDPPKPGIVDSGHRIIKVKPHHQKIDYTTKTLNGIDYKVSPYAIGKYGGSFYASSIGAGPKTLNPLVSTDATSSQIGALLFVGLVEMDPNTGDYVPHLAKTIQILPDHLTYRITLRHGLQWSDGQPITADDVVYTWQNIIEAGLGNPSSRDVIKVNGKLPTVRKMDNLTIEFKTPQPFAPFLGNLGSPILPKHVVEPIIRNNPKDFDSLWGVNAKPDTLVTSGPFLLDSYLSGQRIILKRNPKFFMIDRAGNTLPYLSRYVIEFVQDQNAEVLQFEQGHVDSIGVPGSRVFYIKHLQSPDFKMYDLGPSTGTIFLILNQNPRRAKDGEPYVNPIRSAWFRDLNFRHAIDEAIRRDHIVDNSLMGVGAPLFTPESLTSVFLNTKLAKGHPANLDQAKADLKASGFYSNASGQLFDKTGHKVEFELATNSGNLERESVGVSIKEDLRALGIQVNFKPIDFNVLVGRLDTSHWEGMIMGLTGSPTEPNSGKNVWQSDGALHIFNQRHPGRDMVGTDKIDPYEKQLDAIFDKGATTLDKAKRHAIYNQYQQVVYDNLPFIYLYSPISIVAVRTRLHNLDPTPLDIFHNLPSIWVSQ